MELRAGAAASVYFNFGYALELDALFMEIMPGVNAGSDGPYLRPEIAALRDLHLVGAQEEPAQKPEEPDVVSEPAEPSVPRQEAKRSTGGKPK
ncbi:hypothetical protein R1sor_026636 [Riccia sorocarpa]|uniref:Uncharacterized protein n=1 Tax=Riccia sorocarpa TaxID=122646 RepID=A0ABD3GCL9_9MARC